MEDKPLFLKIFDNFLVYDEGKDIHRGLFSGFRELWTFVKTTKQFVDNRIFRVKKFITNISDINKKKNDFKDGLKNGVGSMVNPECRLNIYSRNGGINIKKIITKSEFQKKEFLIDDVQGGVLIEGGENVESNRLSIN